jgi:hypothetical protein
MAKQPSNDQPVFEIAINCFTFTLYESGQMIAATPDQNATILSPNEIHVLFNLLFIHRDVIIAGSKQEMKKHEPKHENVGGTKNVQQSDWMPQVYLGEAYEKREK